MIDHKVGFLFFDFDGCISKCYWRESLLPKNGLVSGYEYFHELLVLDPPNGEILSLMDDAHMNGYGVIVLTGRPEAQRTASQKWLNNHHAMYDKLIMRADDDKRPSQIYKADVLSLYSKDSIKMIFDDMEKNINHFKELGYPTCLVKA